MKNSKPIKRHAAFVAFSKDHHFGLLLVWKTKTGLKNDISADRISNYILYFFEKDLQQHFREEEQLIFSKLSQDDALRVQAEAEHENIYSIVGELKQNKHDKTLLQRFATTLDDHIRFEERILFNHMQEKLEPSQLEEISQQTAQQREDPDTGWDDHFWLKK